MMQQYNKNAAEDEAYLTAWKNKLDAVQTERETLKKKLLTLINADTENAKYRRKRFQDLRETVLLTDHHLQGWAWAPHFNWLNWLWNGIAYFFPSWTNPQPGSKLRQALLEEPQLIQLDQLVTLKDYHTGRNNIAPFLNDNDYEHAMFFNPMAVVTDLKQRLAQLNDMNDIDEEIRKPYIQRMLDRLYAFKYRLDADLYQYFLDKLYQNYPFLTFDYFYKIYQNEDYGAPESQDFVELHMMARMLMDKFVKADSKTHVHNHYGLILLILLSLTNKKIDPLFQNELFEADPISELLQKLQKNSPKPRIIMELTPTLRDITKKKISEVDSFKLVLRETKMNFYDMQPSSENSLQILKDIFTYFKPTIHPLFMHVARLMMEQLLIDYRKYSYCKNQLVTDNLLIDDPKLSYLKHSNTDTKEDTFNPGHNGYETIAFISEDIIKASDYLDLNSAKTHLDLLDPMRYASTIPAEMKFAEKCVIQLILANAISEEYACKKARTLYDTYQNNLMPTAINWIISRVTHVNKQLAELIQSIFTDAANFRTKAVLSTDNFKPQETAKAVPNHTCLEFPNTTYSRSPRSRKVQTSNVSDGSKTNKNDSFAPFTPKGQKHSIFSSKIASTVYQSSINAFSLN